MVVFKLDKRPIFPPPHLAEEDGLLAVGGDLTPRRLLSAYSQGIFPWYSEGEPILWWYTHPRLVLYPEKFHVNSRLQRYYRNTSLTLTADTAFGQVIEQCAATRTTNNEETWIVDEMKEAYIELHKLGFAHSIECWDKTKLVGGLYGVAIDKVFFGESMFSTRDNSSKFALIYLMNIIKEHQIQIVDCQMTTAHLMQFGAEEISGEQFHNELEKYITAINPQARW